MIFFSKAGVISINTLTPELADGAWSGQYFVDYPITVYAKANPGYRFVGWTGDVEGYEESMDVTLKEEGTYIKFSYKDLECLINEEGNNFGKI